MKTISALFLAALFLGATTLSMADDSAPAAATAPTDGSAVSAQAGGATAAPAKKSEVNRRLKRQNKRINAGVKKGELTKDQAAGLKADEKNIRTEVKSDRAANGGKLTKAEKKKINKELNKESKKIHEEKHPETAK